MEVILGTRKNRVYEYQNDSRTLFLLKVMCGCY